MRLPLRLNAGACAALRKAALFRAAAAARATFLSGKVAKAIHAAASAVLRTVPCAARRPRAGANSPIHGLEHARLSLAPGCAARRWPTLPRSKATARAGTRTRAAGAAVGVGFLWFLSLPIQRKEPARRQPHGTGQPCQAQRMNHRSRAMRGARLRKSAPSPGAMRHPRPVGEGKCARSLTRAMPRQYQGGPPPARQRMSAHAHRHD